jgi:transcriptional regulator with XRE-family HTH domain
MPMNPESTQAGFRARLAQLIGEEEPFVWAKRIGIPSSTFDRIWNGGTIPKAETLLRISEACAVSLDWLLKGGNPTSSEEIGLSPAANSGAPSLDPDLYGRVLEAISAVYKELGWGIALRQLGAEASRIATEIAADGLAPEDMPGAVRGAAAMLRRQLRDAQANPATGNSLKDRA